MTKENSQERLADITAGIEQGIRDLWQSDRYTAYLRVMSRFHRYSLNNTMLIYMQNPNATLVAGYKDWEKNFGRHVRRGEKGMHIIAPMPYKKKVQVLKLDPVTNVPLQDERGNDMMEEKEISMARFRVVSVFDLSQTEGRPIPTLAAELKGDVRHYDLLMQALERSSPYPIHIKELSQSMDGACDFSGKEIMIRAGMSQVQTLCAAVHEVTHARYHGAGNQEKSPKTKEIEAESVAYTVCAYYGIDTGENSFGYLASWSRDKDLTTLRNSLETIIRMADRLICDVDRNFLEIQRSSPALSDLPPKEQPQPHSPSDRDSGEQARQAGDRSSPLMDSGSVSRGDPAGGILFQEGRFRDGDLLPIAGKDAALFQKHGFTVLELSHGEAKVCGDLPMDAPCPEGIRFGVWKREWETGGTFAAQVMNRLAGQEEREQLFLRQKSGCCLAVYQRKEGEELQILRGQALSALSKEVPAAERSHYDLVTTQYLGRYPPSVKNEEILARLYEDIPGQRGADFMHGSVGPGDIMALNRNGQTACYVCDLGGFRQIQGFLAGPERSGEQLGKDGSRADRAEKQEPPVRPGPKQAQNRPSVLEKLRNIQPYSCREPNQSKNRERELG